MCGPQVINRETLTQNLPLLSLSSHTLSNETQGRGTLYTGGNRHVTQPASGKHQNPVIRAPSPATQIQVHLLSLSWLSTSPRERSRLSALPWIGSSSRAEANFRGPIERPFQQTCSLGEHYGWAMSHERAILNIEGMSQASTSLPE